MIKKIIRTILFWARPKKFDIYGVHFTSTVHESHLGKPIRINKESYIFNSSIGDYSYLAGFNTVMNAEIGRFCSIAQNVSISPGRHPSHTYVSTSPYFWSPSKQCGASLVNQHYFDETGKVKIGHDVWIGQNAVIMDGVTIGNGAIIAAGAIVTKDVPAYSIFGGVPAKLIKMRFDAKQVVFLENFKWWDKDESWHKENLDSMHDITKLMTQFDKKN